MICFAFQNRDPWATRGKVVLEGQGRDNFPALCRPVWSISAALDTLRVTGLLLSFPQLCSASDMLAFLFSPDWMHVCETPKDGLHTIQFRCDVHLAVKHLSTYSHACSPGHGLLGDASIEDSQQPANGKAWGVGAGRMVCTVHTESLDIHPFSKCQRSGSC